jgi:hypothetical protein
MGDRADQRRLPVVPARALDPGPFRGAAAPSVGTDEQAAREAAAIVERDTRRAVGVLRDDLRPRHVGDQRIGVHRVDQGAAEVAILQHLAHRAFLDLGMVEMEEVRPRPFARAPVGGLDLEDRLGVVGEVFPQAERVQHPHGGQRQRVGAPVEVRACPGFLGERVDHDGGQAGLRQRDGEAWPVQAAADDQDIRVARHVRDYGPAPGIVHGSRGR